MAANLVPVAAGFFHPVLVLPSRANAWLMRMDKARKTIEFQFGNWSTAQDSLVFPERVDSRSAENYWVYYGKE